MNSEIDMRIRDKTLHGVTQKLIEEAKFIDWCVFKVCLHIKKEVNISRRLPWVIDTTLEREFD